MFYLTGIQHTKTGNIAFPTETHDDVDSYIHKWHHEMDYAMSNEDFIGLTIIVFDDAGKIVLNNNWVRTIETKPIEETTPEE